MMDKRPVPSLRIVCAAIKDRFTGAVIIGVRHWDKWMHEQAKAKWFCGDDPYDQGFIDQHGVFLTRQEAWEVAMSAGQIIKRVPGDEGCLYSENLY